MNAFYPNTPPTYKYQLSYVLNSAEKFRTGLMTVLIQVVDQNPPDGHFGTPCMSVETYHLCRDYDTGVLSARLNASPDKIICYGKQDELYKDLQEFLPTFKKTVGEGSSTAKISIYIANAMLSKCAVFDTDPVV